MIRIDLKLFVTLARFHPNGTGKGPHEVAEGTRVDQLISDLGIDGDLVKLIFVNGRKYPADYVLADKDRVGLFPPVGGG
jgi:sulfur carrier protein ThiS